MPDNQQRPPLTFEGLLGTAPLHPSNLDKHGRPIVRRSNGGHVIAVADPLKPFPPLSWIVVYAGCPSDCADASHGPDLKQGDRLADHDVSTWPWLNQWAYHEDWVLERIDGLQKQVKSHQRTYGEMATKIGAVRAELARARERNRELQAEIDNPSAERAARLVQRAASNAVNKTLSNIVMYGTPVDPDLSMAALVHEALGVKSSFNADAPAKLTAGAPVVAAAPEPDDLEEDEEDDDARAGEPTPPAAIRKRLAELEDGLEYGNEPTVSMLLQALTAVAAEHDNDGAMHMHHCYMCDVPFTMDRTLIAIARELRVEIERPPAARRPTPPRARMPTIPRERFLPGCRQLDGSWLHGRPHSCPPWMH